MKNCGLIVAMLLLSVSSSAYGAAIGSHRPLLVQPQRTSMLGYSIGAAFISVDDPAGDTDAIQALQPITLIYTARLWSNVRYWSELYYYQATLDADLNKIGQDLKRYGMRFSLQAKLGVTSKWSAWLGAGVDISQVKYSSRHTVDNDGFLLEVYPDREETTAAGVMNILGEWTISSVWAVGVKLEQAFPGNGHIQESLVAVTILYRY